VRQNRRWVHFRIPHTEDVTDSRSLFAKVDDDHNAAYCAVVANDLSAKVEKEFQMNKITSSLKTINQIVSVGSVDGILTSAALLRVIGNPETSIVFAQAFTVDKVDVANWASNSKVAFVDLAVNNREPAMTATFVEKVKAAGHVIVAVIDEHNAEDWAKVLAFDSLVIAPVSGKGTEVNSSGALLASMLGSELDAHGKELCSAADAGDRMDFTSHFGGMANQAMKSRIQDDTRRVHMARHFAVNREADEKIAVWVREYEAIIANHSEIEKARVDLGDGIIRISTVGKTVDMTTLLSSLYKTARVVIMEGEMFDKKAGCKTRQIALGTNERSLDLVALLKGAGITEASGFAQKANVSPASEEAAVAAIRAALRK